ncbi:MAG: rod shape-determining protein RodA [Deltaproteobacteria bacterium]|nr:rod shape-determining protein RodA [Deltaproteobacteria bacterium]
MSDLRVERTNLQHFDWALAGIVVVLVAMGLVNLVSAAASGVEGGSDIVGRQLTVAGLGALVIGIVLLIDYRHYDRFAYLIYGVTIALLLLTLLVAEETRGARAWLFSGRFQPSEVAKVGIVIALARYFGRNPPAHIRHLRDLLVPGLIVAIPVGLIAAQKDLGVAVLTLLVGLTLLPLVNVPLRAWLGIALIGAAGLAALWSFGLQAYQQERILGFLDPSRDPLSSGYQQVQSRIAVGSGGLFGTGWQEGTQTQLRFLPTQHTDFAFSVLAEEWGFLGSALVLLLYASLLLWGLLIARNSKDTFGAVLAIGLVGTLLWPATINVAMVLGLAPVIGVPLPLFSYGGSALLSTAVVIGLLLNISMRRYVF